jgi:hypothetical protein
MGDTSDYCLWKFKCALSLRSFIGVKGSQKVYFPGFFLASPNSRRPLQPVTCTKCRDHEEKRVQMCTCGRSHFPCLYIHTHVYVYVYMYIYLHTHINMHTHIIHTHAHAKTSSDVHMRAFALPICIEKHVYIRILTRICTHT